MLDSNYFRYTAVLIRLRLQTGLQLWRT